MTSLKDIKRYKGYMPVRMEREDTVRFICKIVGGNMEQSLWFGKFNGRFTVRFRFGDINEAQIYTKDKTWIPVPLPIWMQLMELETDKLDKDCWKWIESQRQAFGNAEIKKAYAKEKSKDDISNDLLF